MAKEFAFIHETERGQILITKELDLEEERYVVSIWFPLQEASGKMTVKLEDENDAENAFQNLKNLEVVKENLNTVLNQNYL